MKKENNIINIAKEIISLEKELKTNPNNKMVESKIEQLTSSLSLEEMLEIDEYIMKNF